MIASHSFCRFVVCTSMMRISRSSTSQRCSIGLRSGDCGEHLSKVNSSSCSRNQSEMIWALCHGALSCWKYIRRWYTVVIKGWTWSQQYSGRLWCLNDAQLVQSVPRKYPPHHYTTSTSLNRWDKAGWSMLSCSLHQILTLHLNAAEIETHHVFPFFYCSVLVILCELYPPCAVLIWPERHPVWSSAAGVHLLQGSMCCVFRDGVLVITSGYLSYCCLSIISNQSVHSPLTSDINKTCFLFFRPFSVNPRDGCAWKHIWFLEQLWLKVTYTFKTYFSKYVCLTLFWKIIFF